MKKPRTARAEIERLRAELDEATRLHFAAHQRAEKAEAETLEQAKLLAMGGEREARLMARCEELRKAINEALPFCTTAAADILNAAMKEGGDD